MVFRLRTLLTLTFAAADTSAVAAGPSPAPPAASQPSPSAPAPGQGPVILFLVDNSASRPPLGSGQVGVRHPLSETVREELRAKLDVGPRPGGGDGYTVNATGNHDNQTSGGSAKIIIDTEDWDTTLGQNTPDQSGDPNDPHYRASSSRGRAGATFRCCTPAPASRPSPSRGCASILGPDPEQQSAVPYDLDRRTRWQRSTGCTTVTDE